MAAQLPKDFTWKKLKDLARSKVHHGLWVDFQIHQSRNEMGCVRAHGREDMLSLYHLLASQPFSGRMLGVTLFDISNPQGEPLLLCTCNSDHQAQRSYAMARNVVQAPQDYYWQPFIPVMLATSTEPQLAQPAYSASPIPRGYVVDQGYGPNPHDFAVEHRSAQQFISSSAGTLINVSNGCTVTEHRGVFVSNLDHRIDRAVLYGHFARAGRVTHCDVHKGGRCKGHSATVQYASVEEMRTAVRWLDGSDLMGRRIAVRVDTKTATPTDETTRRREFAGESMVVDGSMRSSKTRPQ